MVSRGYDVAEFLDRDAEILRLREQANVFAEDEERALGAVGMPPEGVALDVGCGPGFVAERIRRARPRLSVTGCDVDTAMVELARVRIHAHCADAIALPFDDATYDVAYARLVLRHLSNPLLAINEMRRVVRPGGRVVILDGDDETMVLHPRPVLFYAAVAARHAGMRARGADPLFGRKLVGLLSAAGLTELRIAPIYVHSGQSGPKTFTRILSAWLDAIDPSFMCLADVAAARNEIEAWARSPGAFGMMGLVVVSGSRA